MINQVKQLIEEDNMYRDLLLRVYEQPYISNKDLLDEVSEEEKEICKTHLDTLVKTFILVELTSQSGSSIESRVPQKIFIINPEIEEEIEDVL